MTKPRVILLRGHHTNAMELRAWERLTDDFDVVSLVTRPTPKHADLASLQIPQRTIRSLRAFLPRGRIGDLAANAMGDRYFGLAEHLEQADIVHSAELGPWFSGQPARLKGVHGFKLVITAWETIPNRATYRTRRAARFREETLAATDLFIATTERARACLLLEGAPAQAVVVCEPGIDSERFADGAESCDSPAAIVLSPGRLVWEKGHQDVLRALSALHRGLVRLPDGSRAAARGLIVGTGPEEDRLRAYASDLGLAGMVEFKGHVPYEEMPEVFRSVTCVVLASLPTRTWEEQFGLVLAEAMAAGVPIIASTSGAIPEVLGEPASLFSPGDWLGLAEALARGPLQCATQSLQPQRATRAGDFSLDAAAKRLATAYRRVLSERLTD